MKKQVFLTLVALAVMAGSAWSQTFSRQASIRGGGSPDRGKCTIEVVVDGAAEVEVRGDNAILRNLSGQPAQWRRFECNAVMPPNPGDFRFQGIDGRGRQTLVRDPRQGGVAVVRIEDPQGGSEGYTFDLIWSGFGGQAGGDRGGYRDDRDRGGYRDDRGDAFYRDRGDWYRREGWRGQLFQRVRQDVEHVRQVTFPGGGDQYRLGSVLTELDELQGKLAAGRYDERELDDVIGAMNRVVRDNRMAPRDREILNDDLSRLADFRARHDEYGARGFVGGRDDRDGRDDRGGRQDWFRGEQWRERFFQSIKEDVQRVRSETFPFSSDQYRLVDAIRNLDELQRKLADHRYDERQLDEVIASLDRVVRDNRMGQGDRDVLGADLQRMREFRARHESFGLRY